MITTANSLTWTYDAANRVKTFQSTKDGTILKYDYLGDSQLAKVWSATIPSGSNAPSYGSTPIESYEYSANGNRTKVNGVTTTTGVDNQLLYDGTNYYSYSSGDLYTSTLSGGDTWYFYDLRHRLTGVSYFKDGDQWEIGYDYDAFDRLVGRRVVSGFTYVFDPETEEIISAEPFSTTTVNERRIYDGANMVLELVPDFYNPQVQRRLLYGPAIDQVLVQERGSSADDIDWFLTDNQGTVRDIVDNNRNHDAHYTYDSFGKPLTGMELNGQGVPADGYVLGRLRVLYTGKEYDPLTHIQYNMMRWYSANAGRFITKDPLGLGPDSNPYRYVRNSPTNGTDPSGLQEPGGLLSLDWAKGIRDQPIDLSPNWNQGAGQLHHTFHDLGMWIPKGPGLTKNQLEQQLRSDLSTFSHFNGGHNTQASVKLIGDIAYFNLLGPSGFGSDTFNDDQVAVRLSVCGDEVSGQTLGNHQLVGKRRWRFTVEDRPSGYLVTVQTEAYERTRGNLNRLGAWWAGEGAQMQIWTDYLQNISDYYHQQYNAGQIFMTNESEYLGNAPNPWQP